MQILRVWKFYIFWFSVVCFIKNKISEPFMKLVDYSIKDPARVFHWSKATPSSILFSYTCSKYLCNKRIFNSLPLILQKIVNRFYAIENYYLYWSIKREVAQAVSSSRLLDGVCAARYPAPYRHTEQYILLLAIANDSYDTSPKPDIRGTAQDKEKTISNYFFQLSGYCNCLKLHAFIYI